ncbi:esterase-like activity of phytase family protein [Nioella aestuarii]|uniref:esterase-like activity of phytase family protein n=1 Tax=Nioella aestuarii TaxID=1662864 RepID=UPI003D7FF1AB
MQPRSGQLALIAALAAGISLTAFAQEPGLLGAFSIRSEHPMVGGLSAVEITGGGTGLVALSDRGALIRGQITRDETGRVVALALAEPEILADRNGDLAGRNGRDSEGLAIADDGRIFLSFEGDHRVVLHHAHGDTILPAAEGFAAFQPNASLEALAVGADGTLYTLPERSGDGDPGFPLFRYLNGAWDESWSIPRDGRFLPVGADFDDQGRFYLLERDFSMLFGFANQIRQFEVTSAGMSGGVTVWQSPYGGFSNLEGLSVWRDPQGRLVASMVSDDNFSPILPTELVEIILE